MAGVAHSLPRRGTGRVPRRWWVIAVVPLSLALRIDAGRAEPTYELPDAVSHRATASRLVGRAGPHESLDMSVTLQMRHPDELEGLLAAQQRPGSPEYHRWLTAEEFAARFAPSVQEYEALARWLERQGFGIRRWESRLRIDFSGTVARVERAFGVRMNYYRHDDGIRVANENAPLLPVQFAGTVKVLRLNTFPLARPLRRVNYNNRLVDTMAPRDLQVAYDATPVLDRGIDGSGQVIAVVARSNYNDSDVTQFQQQFGSALHAPVKVFAEGQDPGVGASNGVCQGVQPYAQCVQGEEGEVLLDVQWANAMAPGATVLVDMSKVDIDRSLLDIVNHHAEAKIVSLSFGACERTDRADSTLFGPMYVQAAAQGQTVLVATGDGGADDCQDGLGASVNVLATNANVTAVGGTALDPGFDVSGNATGYVSERVWNDSTGASGGGASQLIVKPAYQVAPGVPADGWRDVPDVSLLASAVTSGYVSVMRGQTVVVGGTSAAAPSWAGIVALLNQAAHPNGSGALNAQLYTLGRQQYNGSAGPFHDVVVGDNSYDGVSGFTAGTGYDLASGLGTPDVDLLARAFAPPPCAGDCNGNRSVTVDEIMTAVNIALGAEPLSACEAADINGDHMVTVDELIEAVNRALNGC